MGDRDPNVPPRPLRVPASRHIASRVALRTHHRARNTVVESRIDMRTDVEAINRGEAIRRGHEFEVNGRTYRMKADDGCFPVSGDGVHEFDRPAFRALGVYNALGATPDAEQALDRLHIEAGPRQEVLRVWRADRGVR